MNRDNLIDTYTCVSCGAIWESEPYEIEWK